MSDGHRTLAERLRQRAERTAALGREASIRKGVRTFVRLNLEQVQALRTVVGTWNAVAAVLSDEGLRWRSGKAVTGHQLRSVYATLRRKGSKTSAAPANHFNDKPRRGELSAGRRGADLGRAGRFDRPTTGQRAGLAALIDGDQAQLSTEKKPDRR